MGGSLGLYLHFPFCVRKCKYCDFLSFASDEETMRLYGRAMMEEIRAAAPLYQNERVDTVFLGGGTPSIMPVDVLMDIFDVLHECFCISPDAEVTMEMNAGTITKQHFPLLNREINRVSVGVQSANDHELQLLGRIHNREDAERSLSLLKEAGIFNINIDLMSGIADQSAESWEETLRWALSMDVPHISAYSLIVEDGTPFAALYDKNLLHLPDEETERRMYHETKEMLKKGGYLRYEISNYAKEGYACRHNIRYWKRENYIGFGIGAASLFNNQRWHNTENLRDYLKHAGSAEAIRMDVEALHKKAQMEEFMFLGLRMMTGVSAKEFEEGFGCSMEEIYGKVLHRFCREKLLVCENGRYALSERGIDISNRILSEFLL